MGSLMNLQKENSELAKQVEIFNKERIKIVKQGMISGMLKKDGVYFYCNLSSPYLYDGEAIKYIDYDLDVKVFPDGKYVLLDEKEYKAHQDMMCYPDEVKGIIKDQMKMLISRIKNKEKPFGLSDIHLFYEQYKSLSKK